MTEVSGSARAAFGGTRPVALVAIAVGLLVAVFGGYEILERTVLAPRVSMRTLHLLHFLRGVASSLLLAGVVAWYFLRRGMAAFPPALRAEALPSFVDHHERVRQHAIWFVHLRWLAASAILAMILIAVLVTRILPPPTLLPLMSWWGALVLANLWFRRWARRTGRPERQIMVQAVVDLVALSGLLNASGGLENPFYMAYLFHVIIAGIVLPKPRAAAVTAVAVGSFVGLVLGEFTHILPHYTILLFPHPRVGAGAGHGAGEVAHGAHDPFFVGGEALSFILVLALAAWLTTLVADRLRQSEEGLERTARGAILERQRLESVVHAARVGMVLLDRDLTVRWFSRRIGEWLGWDESVVGRPCPLYAGPAPATDGPAASVLETGRSAETERSAPGPDGSPRYFRHAASPVQDDQGHIVQIVELVEDVTVHKALEAEALHAGKMSVLGRMAAGIAHEIGNPLSSMATRLRLMESHPEPDFQQQSVALLRRQVDRIGRIVHGISQFARVPKQEWSSWDVNGALEEALSVAELDARAKGIVFRREMSMPSPRVRGVRDQMVQVFLNLLLNATEAMSGRGRVQVETFQEAGEVGIAFVDTGSGMDEHVRARLFEPFFTTKPEGTGLGLSTSYTLVHAHGGRIEVESEPGRGSRFVVRLPAAGAAAAARERSRP